MMRRRRAVRATAGFVALLTLAVACTSKPKKPVPTTPVFGGTLNVAVRDLSTLDPAKATGRGAMFVLSQIFRPLTRVDESGNVVPGAARSWSTSSDGKRWEFTIATATFGNGAPVTAATFAEAFNRIARKATGSDTAFQLESVKGFRDVKVAGTAKTLSGVSVRGNATLILTLDKPFAELARFLAHPALVPLVPGYAKMKSFGATPIGNGPFKVIGARSSAGVTLARSDTWTGTKPYLDGVNVEVRSDAESIWTDLNAGKLDVGEVPAAHLDEAERRYGASGFTPFSAAFYYGFNMRSAKFKSADVRRAISLAIDRAALVRDVYGGTKTPALGIVPAGVPGARTEPCDACTFDLVRARGLLNRVFKGHPPAMTIDHLDAGPSRDLARAVARQLDDAGLKVSLRAHSSADYKKLLAQGKQEIAELGWFSDVPSPDPFLAQQLRTGSANDPSGFSDKTFDKLLDTARGVRDATQRIAKYRAAEDRALALMPLVPLVFFRSRTVARQAVHGFRLDGAGNFDASVVWLS